MSWWSYVHGTIIVSPIGRTQEEKRYVLDTVLNHLPQVTGSEEDMNVYVIQKNGYSSSKSCDEFGQNTNNLINHYSRKRKKYGLLRMQDEYILVIDSSLRDREFNDTFREFNKWLVRLAKRIIVESVMVKIHDFERAVLIQDDHDRYYDLFEYPSWSRVNETGEPAWYEYLLWQPMDNNVHYPALLAYKYFNDENNDKRVENWINRGDVS